MSGQDCCAHSPGDAEQCLVIGTNCSVLSLEPTVFLTETIDDIRP